VAVDTLELQLLGAMQRYQTLQRRLETRVKDPRAIGDRAIAELGTALEELRIAQEQIIEDRRKSEELLTELTAQRARYWALFDEMPEPCLVTHPDTTIIEANQAAAELLNVSQRFLTGKTLSIFVCEDRGRFLEESRRLARERDSVELRLKLRPRERAPLALCAQVRGDGSTLRWALRPASRIAAPCDTSPAGR
jgi:PAS domain S-box-containing protein